MKTPSEKREQTLEIELGRRTLISIILAVLAIGYTYGNQLQKKAKKTILEIR